MDMNLKIDPEFQNKIPPLTDAEFAQLEENILNDGEVCEPIVVWNDTIVDGHNRWKIILANPWLTYRVKEMNFADKWEAFDWMYKNQLGRRNLTDEQKRYLLGKLYETRRHTHGGSRGNQYTKVPSAEKRPLPDARDGVSKIIAEEQHVGKTQVKDSFQFAKGIDAIRESDPVLADAILKSERKIRKKDIQEIGRAKPDEQKGMIEAIQVGDNVPKRKITNEGASSQNRQDRKEIRNIVESLEDDTVMEYTIDNLTEQIRINADAFIRSLNHLLMDHCDLFDGHNREIVTAIDESITTRINQIKETFNNGTQL